jgi:TP901 family phage tail tape measure protein
MQTTALGHTRTATELLATAASKTKAEMYLLRDSVKNTYGALDTFRSKLDVANTGLGSMGTRLKNLNPQISLLRSELKQLSSTASTLRSTFDNLNTAAATLQGSLNKDSAALQRNTTNLRAFDSEIRRITGTMKMKNLTVAQQVSLMHADADATRRASKGAIELYFSMRNIIRIGANILFFGAVYKGIQYLREATKEASEWSKRISEIRTISDRTVVSVEQWQSGLVQLSNAFGIPVIEAAEGAYQALSNQVSDARTTFAYLTQEQILATTAVSTLKQAVDASSSIIQAWSLSSASAASINAILFKGVELGRFRLADIAETIGRVSILSSQLGVTFVEQTAAMSLITKQGVNASEAMTYLRNVEFALIKPTEVMTAKLREWGYTSGENAIAGLGFVGVLQRIAMEAAKGGSQASEFVELMGRLRSVIGLTALSQKNYTDEVAAYSRAAEQYLTAYEERLLSYDTRANQQLQRFHNTWMAVGQSILRVLVDTAEAHGGAGQMLVKFVGYLEDLTVAFAAYKLAVGSAALTTTIYAGVVKTVGIFTAVTTAETVLGNAALAHTALVNAGASAATLQHSYAQMTSAAQTVIATTAIRSQTVAMYAGIAVKSLYVAGATAVIWYLYELTQATRKYRWELIAAAEEEKALAQKRVALSSLKIQQDLDKRSEERAKAFAEAQRLAYQANAELQTANDELASKVKDAWVEAANAMKVAIEAPLNELHNQIEKERTAAEKMITDLEARRHKMEKDTAAANLHEAILNVNESDDSEIEKLKKLTAIQKQLWVEAEVAIRKGDTETYDLRKANMKELDREIATRAKTIVRESKKETKAEVREEEKAAKEEQARQARQTDWMLNYRQQSFGRGRGVSQYEQMRKMQGYTKQDWYGPGTDGAQTAFEPNAIQQRALATAQKRFPLGVDSKDINFNRALLQLEIEKQKELAIQLKKTADAYLQMGSAGRAAATLQKLAQVEAIPGVKEATQDPRVQAEELILQRKRDQIAVTREAIALEEQNAETVTANAKKILSETLVRETQFNLFKNILKKVDDFTPDDLKGKTLKQQDEMVDKFQTNINTAKARAKTVGLSDQQSEEIFKAIEDQKKAALAIKGVTQKQDALAVATAKLAEETKAEAVRVEARRKLMNEIQTQTGGTSVLSTDFIDPVTRSLSKWRPVQPTGKGKWGIKTPVERQADEQTRANNELIPKLIPQLERLQLASLRLQEAKGYEEQAAALKHYTDQLDLAKTLYNEFVYSNQKGFRLNDKWNTSIVIKDLIKFRDVLDQVDKKLKEIQEQKDAVKKLPALEDIFGEVTKINTFAQVQGFPTLEDLGTRVEMDNTIKPRAQYLPSENKIQLSDRTRETSGVHEYAHGLDASKGYSESPEIRAILVNNQDRIYAAATQYAEKSKLDPKNAEKLFGNPKELFAVLLEGVLPELEDLRQELVRLVGGKTTDAILRRKIENEIYAELDAKIAAAKARDLGTLRGGDTREEPTRYFKAGTTPTHFAPSADLTKIFPKEWEEYQNLGGGSVGRLNSARDNFDRAEKAFRIVKADVSGNFKEWNRLRLEMVKAGQDLELEIAQGPGATRSDFNRWTGGQSVRSAMPRSTFRNRYPGIRDAYANVPSTSVPTTVQTGLSDKPLTDRELVKALYGEVVADDLTMGVKPINRGLSDKPLTDKELVQRLYGDQIAKEEALAERKKIVDAKVAAAKARDRGTLRGGDARDLPMAVIKPDYTKAHFAPGADMTKIFPKEWEDYQNLGGGSVGRLKSARDNYQAAQKAVEEAVKDTSYTWKDLKRLQDELAKAGQDLELEIAQGPGATRSDFNRWAGGQQRITPVTSGFRNRYPGVKDAYTEAPTPEQAAIEGKKLRDIYDSLVALIQPIDQTLQVAGFALGGQVGTDRIPAWLSPGERVLTAQQNRAFAPYLFQMGSASSTRSSQTNYNFGDINLSLPSGSTKGQADAVIGEIQRRVRLGTLSI